MTNVKCLLRINAIFCMLCMVVVFCVNAYQLRSLSGFWQMELQHVNFEAFIVIRLNKMDGCCYDGYVVWFVFRKSKHCDHFYLACWVSRQYIKYMVLACCLLYVTVMMVMNSPKERPKKSRQSFRSISLIQSAFFFFKYQRRSILFDFLKGWNRGTDLK